MANYNGKFKTKKIYFLFLPNNFKLKCISSKTLVYKRTCLCLKLLIVITFYKYVCKDIALLLLKTS